MKKELKFLGLIALVLLISTALLVGCIRQAADSEGQTERYARDEVQTPEETSYASSITTLSPTTQSELREKFSAMSHVDEQANSISVITPEYLEEYWADGQLHALSLEDILFLIQDTIELFFDYDLVICEENPRAAGYSIAERYPEIGGTQFEPAHSTGANTWKIHHVILYRIAALSSPEAFILAQEALDYVGRTDEEFQPCYTTSLYYIPSYTEDVDRDAVLRAVGLYDIANEEPGSCVDYLGLAYLERAYIDLAPASCPYPGAWIPLFPTDK